MGDTASDAGIGFVYLIQAEKTTLSKIGYSRSPEKRARKLDHGSPLPLHLTWTSPGTKATEQLLHDKLEIFRDRWEWFNFGPYDPLKVVSKAAADPRTPRRGVGVFRMTDPGLEWHVESHWEHCKVVRNLLRERKVPMTFEEIGKETNGRSLHLMHALHSWANAGVVTLVSGARWVYTGDCFLPDASGAPADDASDGA
ncbi:GIY-YIG nuclease family protein [Kitasatospora sp. NPDC048343]|uniref:GIY-YIG nuclease family protein n=1 Tax=Kitasatospora sp. NPDC048343 TaxID=3154717 RepID=UPI0033C7DEC7